MNAQTPQPSPERIMQTLWAFRDTAVLKAAIEMSLFSTIGRQPKTAPELARRCAAAERGMRILCDYLSVAGFLTKEDGRYALTPESSAFLDRASPTYMGGIADFLLHPRISAAFQDVAAVVRRGGTVLEGEGTLEPEDPVWVDFARAMAPVMALPAQLMAPILDPEGEAPLEVLDMAAGHGLFGISLAQRNPRARVVALDWPRVLEVARENAAAAGVAARHRLRPGSAFEVDLGGPYDLVLITNFLHHFNPETCAKLLRKVHAALAPGGRAAILEFVPDEGRLSPPDAVVFSMVMLATTPEGDAYTCAELEEMCRRAGFAGGELHPLPPTSQQLFIAGK